MILNVECCASLTACLLSKYNIYVNCYVMPCHTEDIINWSCIIKKLKTFLIESDESQNVMFDISDDMTKTSELSRYNGKRKISRQTRLPREFYAGFDRKNTFFFSILRNERKVN